MDARHREKERATRILWYFRLCTYDVAACVCARLCTFLCAYTHRTQTSIEHTYAKQHPNVPVLYLQNTSREQDKYTDSSYTHSHRYIHVDKQQQQHSMQWVDNFYRWVRIHRQLMNLFRGKTGLKVPFHLSAQLTHAVAHMSAFELHSLLGISSSSSFSSSRFHSYSSNTLLSECGVYIWLCVLLAGLVFLRTNPTQNRWLFFVTLNFICISVNMFCGERNVYTFTSYTCQIVRCTYDFWCENFEIKINIFPHVQVRVAWWNFNSI